jgi:replication factor C subunit 3/5
MSSRRKNKNQSKKNFDSDNDSIPISDDDIDQYNLENNIDNDNDDNEMENELENIENESKSKKKDKNKNIREPKIDISTSHMEIMELMDEFKQEEKEEKDYTCMPWVEEFRPKKLKEVIDHEEHISTLRKLNKKKQFPNLLLSGPPGTGKTSTIMACAKNLYKDNYSLMVLDINASEERGIDVVRHKIKNFIMTKGIYTKDNQPLFKLVILDEADAMTEDAQSMLVNIMEKYIHNARFCLMCNYIKKINPAIQSRCTILKFSPLKREFVIEKIKQIANSNNFNVTPDGIDTLIKISNGDMRKVINTLQATHMAFDDVDMINICKSIGYPYPEDIEKIHHIIMNKKIQECHSEIEKKLQENGYSLMDIVHELFTIYINKYMEKKSENADIAGLITNLRDIETNLTMCQNENIQLAGVISAFKLAQN